MNEISEWIKSKYGFEERKLDFEQIWTCFSGIVGFLYKNSYFCNELRRKGKYTAHTFQYLSDHCKFEGDLILFNSKINHSYSLLMRFIWLFNPKYAIIEVDLDNPTPMIISAPNVQFEMLLSAIIIDDEIENKEKDQET